MGNRITAFNLQTGASYTLPFETRKDISRFALSPDGKTLIAVDEGTTRSPIVVSETLRKDFNFFF